MTADGDDSRQEKGVWVPTKMWADSDLVYDAEIGDVWPGHPGNEVVVGGNSFWTTMIYGHEDAWESVPLFKEAWYVTNIAIGDLDPSEPGNEIVNIGWHGNVSLVYWKDSTSEWVREVIVNGLEAHLDWGYGLAIDDFDPRYEGNELAMTDDLGKLVIVRKDGDSWAYEVIWQDGGPGIIDPYLDTVMLVEIDPDHDGKEILVAGGSKWLTEVYYNGSGEWAIKRLWRDRLAPVQVTVGELLSDHDRNEIAVVGLTNNMTILHWNGTSWEGETVYTDSDVIYDVEIGTVLPEGGTQVLTGGWSANISLHQLQGSPPAWQSEVVHKRDDFVFAVSIGDFDDLHTGNEIVIADNAGGITKLQYETPDFVLYVPGPESSTSAGSEARFDIMVYSRGGFKETVTLTAKGLPAGWTAGFSPTGVTPSGLSVMTVEVPPDTVPVKQKVTVEGNSASKQHSIEVVVTVLPPGEKDFGLRAMPSSQSVVADYSVKYTIISTALNGFSDPISVSASGLPDGATAEFSSDIMTPPDSITMEVRTIVSSPSDTHYIMVKAEGGGKEHVVAVTLTIKDASSPDFSLTVAPSVLEAKGSITVSVAVSIISQYGFADPVTLSASGMPKGMDVVFDPVSVTPSGQSTMNITTLATVARGTYYIEVTGTSGSTVHGASVRVNLNTNGDPDFSIGVSPTKGDVTASASSYFNVTLSPINGFGADVTLSASGLPDDTIVTFSPEEISPSINAIMEVRTHITTPQGVHSLVIGGTGSGLHRTTTITLEVLPAQPLLNMVRLDEPSGDLKDGDRVKFKAWIENIGPVNATNVEVELVVDGEVVSKKKTDVGKGSSAWVDISWTAVEGEHNVTARMVDRSDLDIGTGSITRTVSVSGRSVSSLGPIIWIALVIVIVVVLVIAIGYLLGRSGGVAVDDDATSDDEDVPKDRKKRGDGPAMPSRDEGGRGRTRMKGR